MANHQKLLSLYNELDEALRKYYRDNNYSNSCIMRYIHELERTGIKEYQDASKRLDMIRVLRNDLIHQFDMNASNLIEVTDDTIAFLSLVVKTVSNPIFASDVMTPIEKLQYVRENQLDENVEKIVASMRKEGHCNMPILSNDMKVIGVFTPNVLFDYLNAYDNKLKDIKLRDLSNFYPISKHFSETFMFVSKSTNAFDLANIFFDSIATNKKLSMIFVTDNGKENQKLLGVIVLKDILNNRAL